MMRWLPKSSEIWHTSRTQSWEGSDGAMLPRSWEERHDLRMKSVLLTEARMNMSKT